MFLCLPIIFIISISDTRSDRSLSVASSVPGTTCQLVAPQPSKAPSISLPFLSILTFQHLHSHGDRLGSAVLVNADSFCHDDLAKAAFSKRLTKCQPAHRNRGS